jgi:uncharacterized membrane protein (GlpM family)
MIASLRANENVQVVLWLLKDLCWLMEYRVAGLLMVAPTVAMAVHIAWRSRADQQDLFHALAVILWIMANSTWMLGDFFFGGHGHGLAQALFLTGLGILGFYHLILGPSIRRRTGKDPATQA